MGPKEGPLDQVPMGYMYAAAPWTARMYLAARLLRPAVDSQPSPGLQLALVPKIRGGWRCWKPGGPTVHGACSALKRGVFTWWLPCSGYSGLLCPWKLHYPTVMCSSEALGIR